MCPTHSDINERFMKIVSKRVHAKRTINDYFRKTKTDYILEFGIDYDKISKENTLYRRDVVYEEIHKLILNMGIILNPAK